MIQKAATIVITVLLAGVYCEPAIGQAPPPTILTIDVANFVEYQADNYDSSKYGKNPDKIPSAGPGQFGVVTLIGDIRAVNGQSAKGLYAGRTRVLQTSANASPGVGIADISRTAIREQIFEILQPDGTPIGTVIALGFSGGPLPPGAPSGPTGGNWAIVGGTGACLGARGQVGGWGATQFATSSAASMAEDPANRRAYYDLGKFRFTVHVIPMTRPEILTTASGPAVTHSNDFSLVTTSKPAVAGEVLSLFATGLGPTVPGVDPGQPFPPSPPSAVNSPVQVAVNGKPAEVLGAVGFPGAVDGYQINFRVPADTAKGVASIQVSAAWIGGTAVSILVQ